MKHVPHHIIDAADDMLDDLIRYNEARFGKASEDDVKAMVAKVAAAFDVGFELHDDQSVTWRRK